MIRDMPGWGLIVPRIRALRPAIALCSIRKESRVWLVFKAGRPVTNSESYPGNRSDYGCIQGVSLAG